ncbi:hypothetical protein TNCV_1788961 [Trichonephila clavipes]|nr:hypothetical protein TNCV_1788961 [Trichonephila clavipes]
MVKVLDRGWPCHEFEPSTTKYPPCRGAMRKIIRELKRPPVGVSDRDPRNSLLHRASCTPVVSRSFEHQIGEQNDLERFHPNFLMENTLEVARVLPTLFFHQPH